MARTARARTARARTVTARTVQALLGVPVLAVALLTAGAGHADAAETIAPPASGTWTVVGHGNGHGHGLSQYGARGAARKGLSAGQIIAFYYPNTALKTLGASTVRVLIGDDAGSTTVAVPSGQTITLAWTGGSQTITSASASKVRLVQSGSKLVAQKYKTSWTAWGSATPTSAYFSATSGVVRLYQSSGSTAYRGSVGGVISGGARMTVNRLPLDSYVRGVVPREMPSSWDAAAVQAQAIAARSYARYAVEHQSAQPYDICDSTNCQVYGGQARYDSSGNRLYGEESGSDAAVSATANEVATYSGATIFAQFSASNGGWTTDGGQPYLIAKADPYEQYSDDPYLNWTEKVSVSSVASAYGLATLTGLTIDSRDGHGEWGGRVLTATVSGTTSGGAARSVSTSGYALADAMGLPHNWFEVSQQVASAPQSVSVQSADASARVAWSAPATTGSSSITGYQIAVPGLPTVSVGSGARSAWVGGLVNGATYHATVRAMSSAGAGTSTSVVLSPHAAPSTVRAVVPARLLDTRTLGPALTPGSPFIFGVGGHGSIPLSATAVQLAVTVVTPSANGILRVYTDGSPAPVTAGIAYRTGETVASTVTVPLVTSGRIVLAPSAGSVHVVLDQVGYSTASADSVTAVAPSLVMETAAVGSSRTLSLRSGLGAGATAAILQVTASSAHGAGWLRLWPSDRPAPTVSQVGIPAGRRVTNTVVVPLSASGTVSLGASNPAIGAQVSIVGWLAPSGGSALESVPPSPIADSTARVGSDLLAGSSPRTLVLAGHGQLPASGVKAVLVQVTSSHASATGQLRVYPTGTTPGRPITATVVKGWTSTALLLLPLGTGGAVSVATTGPSAQVAFDVLGYTTDG